MNLLSFLCFLLVFGGMPVLSVERRLPPGSTSEPRPQLHTFGQFIGTWKFTLSNYLPDGTIQYRAGKWTFRWLLDGEAVQDFWCMASSKPTRGRRCEGTGTTVRVFDATHGTWKVVWIAPASGTIELFTAREEQDQIVLRGNDGNGTQDRWTFFNIRKNAFRWKAESSTDGSTWTLRQEMLVEATP